MGCKPDIKTTNAMYELYQKGYSLAQVGIAFGVSRQSIYDRFDRQSLKMRERVKPLPFIIYQSKKYTRRKGGYYACTNGNRDYLHRIVWENYKGKIPKSHDVHHIDNDKTNNHIENLELISKPEHSSKYPGRQNQYTVSGAK